MQIRDLYYKYNIMPQLREHQLRVGGIVRLITPDHDSIITALVHDMGNIVKFNNLDPYWSKVQEKFWNDYGRDEHAATDKILREVGMDRYADYFKEESKAYDNDSLNASYFSAMSKPAMLTLYGDLRVRINGVCSIEERLKDLEERYHYERPERKWAGEFENYVQTLTSVDLKSINEAMVATQFDTLLTMTV